MIIVYPPALVSSADYWKHLVITWQAVDVYSLIKDFFIILIKLFLYKKLFETEERAQK